MATDGNREHPAELPPDNSEIEKPTRQVPWQLWVVLALLGIEGVGNLLSALDHPIALCWLTAKVLFITGLLKAWKWVFVLFVIVARYHVVAFLPINPIASLLNALLIILTFWSSSYFFRK